MIRNQEFSDFKFAFQCGVRIPHFDEFQNLGFFKVDSNKGSSGNGGFCNDNSGSSIGSNSGSSGKSQSFLVVVVGFKVLDMLKNRVLFWTPGLPERVLGNRPCSHTIPGRFSRLVVTFPGEPLQRFF